MCLRGVGDLHEVRRLTVWPANSIGTQISYAAHPWLLGGNKMYDCIVGNGKKKLFLYFILILFDTSLSFYVSMFCESGRYRHCRLCDSFFHLFLSTLIKMVSSIPPLILKFFLSDLAQGRRSVGPGPGSKMFANGISWQRYTVVYFVGAVRLVEP